MIGALPRGGRRISDASIGALVSREQHIKDFGGCSAKPAFLSVSGKHRDDHAGGGRKRERKCGGVYEISWKIPWDKGQFVNSTGTTYRC
jgi:hypothetical protein